MITGTWLVGTAVTLDGVEANPFPDYQGAAHVRLDSNNVASAVDWVCVITW